MGVVLLALTPIYIKLLGARQWGLVALCMTLQSILYLLDLGLSQLMPREVAKDKDNAAQTFYYFLRLYTAIGAIAGFLSFLAAGYIARLFGVATEGNPEVTSAFRLVSLQFFFQFANGAAVGYWNGMERQRKANLRLAGFALLKHILALTTIKIATPDVVSYMTGFAVASAVEAIFNLSSVVCQTRAARKRRGDSPTNALRSALGFGIAVLIGTLTSQIDRFYLARTVAPEYLGAYIVAANLALAMLQLAQPLQKSFTPQIMQGGPNVRGTLRKLLRLTFLVSILPCLIMAALAEHIFTLWLRDTFVATQGYPIFRILVIAVALNAIYGVVYLDLLRRDLYWKVTILNLAILCCQILFLTALGPDLGITAGAISWLICSGIQISFSVAYLRNRKGK